MHIDDIYTDTDTDADTYIACACLHMLWYICAPLCAALNWFENAGRGRIKADNDVDIDSDNDNELYNNNAIMA